MNAWQPIETAPKDGTRILVHERGTVICCIAFFNGAAWMADETHYFGDGLHDDISLLESEVVTHWMPLPEPPQSLQKGCRKPLAPGQHWAFCGEVDMGQTEPALCVECGGNLRLAAP